MEIKMNVEPINVLLVDDDAADQRLVKHILTASSREPVQFNIETAGTVSEAIDRLSNVKYDIVLLDLGLPDSHGIDTVQRVHKANQKVPIVVLTGLDDDEMGLEAIKCGAEDYIVKGAPLEYLLVRTIRYAIQRKRAGEELRELKKQVEFILGVTKTGLDIIDSNYNMVYIDPEWQKIYGDPAGRKCYEYFMGREQVCPDCGIPKALETKKLFVSEEILVKEGNRPVQVSTIPFQNEKGEWLVAEVNVDITERKRFEKRQAELLEKLKSVNQELEDFAYVISHDLKAPLRGIKTLADWISTDYADKLGEKGGEQMKLLLSRADRMHNLIDGVLQYSRVGHVKEEMARVDLNEFVPEVIDMVAPPQNITVTVENELPVIECELTRIMQVFQNLVSNAVKYMDKPKGQVKVGCVDENGFWKFSVADNGPGIEEKHFEKIFKIFQTLSPRDEFESTGIGLTVAKKIVELYGGRIWVESKVGQGSTFFFTLPKQESEVSDNERLQANIVC